MTEDLKALEIRATNLVNLMEQQLKQIDVVLDLSKAVRIDVDWMFSVDKRLIEIQYKIIDLNKQLML